MTPANADEAIEDAHARRLSTLMRSMQQAVAAETSVQDRLDTLTKLIARHVGADVCSIYLRRRDDSLELYSTVGLKREAVHQTRLQIGEGLVGVVAASKRRLATADAPLHPKFVYKAETGEDPFRSFLGAPLLRSGKALGVLVLQNEASRLYTDDDVEAVELIATLLAEVCASGELLSREETEAVGAVLRRPERADGVGAAPGVAIGRVLLHEAPAPKRKVFAVNVSEETARLEAGLEALRAAVDGMLSELGLDGVSREILEAYRLFAYDRAWMERLRAAVRSGFSAETAVEQVRIEMRSQIGAARDPYLRDRLHDLDDLANRLLRHLSGRANDSRDAPAGAILVARSMGPAELLDYGRDTLGGLILAEASPTSHVAVVARGLQIPAITGLVNATDLAFEGDEVAIDGASGEAHFRPAPEIVANFAARAELLSARQAAFAKEKDLPTVTRDGVAIELYMNAGLEIDMPQLAATGAAGIGLFRTELQFLIGAQLPRADAQERLYRAVLDAAHGKPVVFRTVDLGSDKAAPFMKAPHEPNPALGWRGLRLSLDRPGILRPQLRALVNAAAGRTLHVLFPMVADAHEVDEARALLDRELDIAKRRGRRGPDAIRIGAMIETPAAAWACESIAARVDFLSIGGNDLAQFFFAADRQSERMRRRFDPLDPGYLDFIRTIIDRADRIGCPLSYCGEQTGDPLMGAALIGLGLRRLSAPATRIGPFRRLIRSLDQRALGAWMRARFRSPTGAVPAGAFRAEMAAWLAREGADCDLA